MKRTLQVAAAALAALAAQSLLARALGPGPLWVDLPLVAVVFAALTGGRVVGLFTGTIVGLAQDAMGGGVLGVGSMAKSIAGFLAGVTGTQFIVTQTAPRLLVFASATVLHGVVFMGLYFLLGLREFERPWLEVTFQAIGNCLVGGFAFATADALPGIRERWRARREYRRRTRFR